MQNIDRGFFSSETEPVEPMGEWGTCLGICEWDRVRGSASFDLRVGCAALSHRSSFLSTKILHPDESSQDGHWKGFDSLNDQATSPGSAGCSSVEHESTVEWWSMVEAPWLHVACLGLPPNVVCRESSQNMGR